MVKKRRALLNAPPYHVLLVRAQRYLRRRAHKLDVRAVIVRGHIGVEPFIVYLRQHGAALIVQPHPVHKFALDGLGLLHGCGCQLLVNNHDGAVGDGVTLPRLHFHLDGTVGKQRLDDFGGRIFGYPPHVGFHGTVVDTDPRFPAPQHRDIVNVLMPMPPVDTFFQKIHDDFGRNPRRAKLDANIHGLYLGGHGLTQSFHICLVLGHILSGLFRLMELAPDVACEVLVTYFPLRRGRIEEYQLVPLQFLLRLLTGTTQKLPYARQVDLAALTQGNHQRVLGILRLFRHSGGLEHTLRKNGRLGRRSRPHGHAVLAGQFS